MRYDCIINLNSEEQLIKNYSKYVCQQIGCLGSVEFKKIVDASALLNYLSFPVIDA